MTRVSVISVDGLHRCGKGTQLSLLEQRYADRFPVMRCRGEGSRTGFGAPGDCVSAWWQAFNARYPTYESRDNGYWNAATDRLNAELDEIYHVTFPAALRREHRDSGILLLDRSLISTYFRKGRDDDRITFKDVVTYASEDGTRKAVVLPDISFILHCPPEVLLARNAPEDGPEKRAFRAQNIARHYDAFERMTRRIAAGFPLFHIDATRTPGEISQEIACLLQAHGGLGDG